MPTVFGSEDRDVLSIHRQFQESRDPALRDWLVRHYEGLALQLAGRAARQLQERDDLRQVAMLGLVKALDRYDVERGTAFTTFAWATISGELKRYRRDRDRSIHVPRRLQETYLRTAAAIEQCTNELGRSPTVQDLAQATGDSVEEVIEALAIRDAYKPLSIDAPVTRGGDDEMTIQLGRDDPGFDQADEHDWIGRLVGRLPERERTIVNLRFVDEMTQSEIARTVGLSQMQVSRLLSRSLERLRRWSLPERTGAVSGRQ